MIQSRALALLMACVVLAVQSGCARFEPPVLPDPPSEAFRSTFGRVAVAWSSETREFRTEIPSSGACSAAGRGALLGMAADMMITFEVLAATHVTQECEVFFAPCVFAIGVVLLPVGALIGAGIGASKAPSAPEIHTAIRTLDGVVADRQLARDIAVEVLSKARWDLDDPLELLAPGATVAGFDSVLELDLPVLLCEGTALALQFVVLQHARLIRLSDRRILYEVTLARPLAGKQPLLDWAKNNGAPLRSALKALDGEFARRLVEELFLLHPLPADREWKAVRP